jgi:hypothetical protein
MMISTPPRHEDAAHSWANGLRAELGRFLPELPGGIPLPSGFFGGRPC